VARLLRSHWLPSDWDTRRLLRFLAGLTMLALAFGAPAATAAPPAPSPAVVMTASAEASVTLGESVSAPSSVRVEPAAVPAEAPAVLAVPALIAVLTGAALRVRGGRAPPTY
jgi:hypothetical protein